MIAAETRETPPAAEFEPGGSLRVEVPQLAPPGERLDRWLAGHVRECSRSYLQKLIRGKRVLLDGSPAKASKSLTGGELLELSFPEAELEPAAEPEDLPVRVVFEDEVLVVVDKPAGMPSHPSCGHARGTLANAMAFHCERLSALNGPVRPGIVHRLDMDTSGLLVVAKTDSAHRELARQFADREIAKRYLALVHRAMPELEGTIEKQLGRHPTKRKKQAVLHAGGRAAKTAYRTLARLGAFSYLKLAPRTGRTHQLRVHLASCGCPILCDALYGRELEFPQEDSVLGRQALHAAELGFTHPLSGERVNFEAAPPGDFAAALELLRARAAAGGEG